MQSAALHTCGAYLAELTFGLGPATSGTCLVHRKTECWVTKMMITKRGTKEPAAFTLTLVSWPLVTSKEHCITIWVRRYGNKVDSIIAKDIIAHVTQLEMQSTRHYHLEGSGQVNIIWPLWQFHYNRIITPHVSLSHSSDDDHWLDIDIDIDLRC